MRAKGLSAALRKLSAALRLYWILASASVRAAMQYKFDFVSTSIIQAVTGAFDYYFLAVILWKFDTVAGWKHLRVGLLFAVSKIGIGIYRVLSEELEQFERYIGPRRIRFSADPPMAQLLCCCLGKWTCPGSLGPCKDRSGVHILPTSSVPDSLRGRTALLAMACLCSAMLFFIVGLATASAAFLDVRIDELQTIHQERALCSDPAPSRNIPGLALG